MSKQKVKQAMVAAFAAHYGNHPKKAIIVEQFKKSIHFRRGTYTNDPGYETAVSDKDLADKIGKAASDAGARRVNVCAGMAGDNYVVAAMF